MSLTFEQFYASKIGPLTGYTVVSEETSRDRKVTRNGFLITSINILFIFFCCVTVSKSENIEKVSDIEIQIRSVISDQIDAFGVVDIERAYSHASKTIKSLFPSAEVFGSMVQQSYPMIWSPKEYRFLSAEIRASGVIQRIIFTDKKENLHLFDYIMLKNEVGDWVINGVIPVLGEKGA